MAVEVFAPSSPMKSWLPGASSIISSASVLGGPVYLLRLQGFEVNIISFLQII